MNSVRIIVHDRNAERLQAVAIQLLEMGNVEVATSAHWLDSIRKIVAWNAMAILYGHESLTDGARLWLRLLAGIDSPPAVGFYGRSTDVIDLESNCQRFKLRYLGCFAFPIDGLRLRNTVTILRQSIVCGSLEQGGAR